MYRIIYTHTYIQKYVCIYYICLFLLFKQRIFFRTILSQLTLTNRWLFRGAEAEPAQDEGSEEGHQAARSVDHVGLSGCFRTVQHREGSGGMGFRWFHREFT